MPPTKPNTESNPLPLSDTLHDLAVLRASDIDLAAFLPAPVPSDQNQAQNPDSEAVGSNQKQISTTGDSEERDRFVARSFEYVREGRAAIRMLHRGDVDNQGARVDKVRNELEELLSGLWSEER